VAGQSSTYASSELASPACGRNSEAAAPAAPAETGPFEQIRTESSGEKRVFDAKDATSEKSAETVLGNMFMRPPSAQIPATANVENKSKDLVAAAESKSKAAALQSLSSIHDIASAKQNYLSTASSELSRAKCRLLPNSKIQATAPTAKRQEPPVAPPRHAKKRKLVEQHVIDESVRIREHHQAGCCTQKVDATAVQCGDPACGRFYHVNCLSDKRRYPSQLAYVDGGKWRCPVCSTCAHCNVIIQARQKTFKCPQCTLYYIANKQKHSPFCVICGHDF